MVFNIILNMQQSLFTNVTHATNQILFTRVTWDITPLISISHLAAIAMRIFHRQFYPSVSWLPGIMTRRYCGSSNSSVYWMKVSC